MGAFEDQAGKVEGMIERFMGKPLYYKLGANREVLPASREEGDAYFADPASRRVARDILANGVEVSTVFLVIDHNWGPWDEPLCFESMAFMPAVEADGLTCSGPEIECERYATWGAAAVGHKAMVERLVGWEPTAEDEQRMREYRDFRSEVVPGLLNSARKLAAAREKPYEP